MPPFNFTGANDIDEWVNELDDHFEGNNVQEAEMLPTAMQYLSVDVRSAIDQVQSVLQQIIDEGPVGGEWDWSYPRLVVALRGMQNQIEDYRRRAEEAKTNTILKGCAIVGGGIATAVALPVVVTGALGLAGFSAGGVVAGSVAAAMQSAMGAVRAGSFFAFCQSAAAGGVAMGAVVGASTTAGAVGAGAASLANLKAWADSQKVMPSHSWVDGDRFVPSPELLFALLQL